MNLFAHPPASRILERGATAPSSTAPAQTVGVKRTANGEPKTIDNTPEAEDLVMIKRFLSNIKIYTNNIIRENEAVRTQLKKPNRTITYEGRKLAVAVHMLEAILTESADEPIVPGLATPPNSVPRLTMEEKVDAEVKRVVNLKLQVMRDGLIDDLVETVLDSVGEMVEEAVTSEMEEAREDFCTKIRDDIIEEIMDDDMKEVKETVMLGIKARKAVGDIEDTQDQLRLFGDMFA